MDDIPARPVMQIKQLTDAPKLLRFSDMTHAWSVVCTQRGSSMLWHGDLGQAPIKKAYDTLVRDGELIVTHYRVAEGHYRHFAKLAVPKPAPEPRRRVR